MMKKMLTWLFFIIIFLSNRFVSYAFGDGDSEYNTIVFLADFSSSMKEQKEDMQSLMLSALEILPEEVRIAYVSYSSEIIISAETDFPRSKIADFISSEAVGGYSNSGAGLSEAVKLVTESKGKGKIIWFSDGETDMKYPEEIEKSKRAFMEAVELSKSQGIEIDLYSFAEDLREEDIYSSTQDTSGDLIFCSQLSRAEIVKNLIFNTLDIEFKRLETGEVYRDGLISIYAADAYMDETKILVLSETGLGSINLDTIDAEEMHDHDFALISVSNPVKEYSFHIAGDISEIYSLDQYNLSLDLDIAKDENTDKGKLAIEAELKNGREENIVDADMQDMDSVFYIFGKEYVPRLKENKLCFEVNLADLEDADVKSKGKIEIEYRIFNKPGNHYHVDQPVQSIHFLFYQDEDEAKIDETIMSNTESEVENHQEEKERKSLIPLYTVLGLLIVSGLVFIIVIPRREEKRVNKINH